MAEHRVTPNKAQWSDLRALDAQIQQMTGAKLFGLRQILLTTIPDTVLDAAFKENRIRVEGDDIVVSEPDV